jgi:chromosome segregation ATPase
MTTLNYPHISTNPAYKAAAEKLAMFNAQHNECQTKLNNLQAERAIKLNESENLNKAQSLAEIELQLKGGTLRNHTEQIDDAAKQLNLLAKAVEAQRAVVAALTQELSIAAGDSVKEQHKAIVKRMIEAVQAVHDINQEEYQLRESLDVLGYTKRTVQPMPYLGAYAPNDGGSPAYYWMQDAAPYVQTATQKEAITRKNKLFALAG